MAETEGIISKVDKIGDEVSIILLMIRGSEDFGPGLADQIKENRLAIQQLMMNEQKRAQTLRSRIQLGAMLVVLVPFVAAAYQILVISELRSSLAINPVAAVVLGAILLILLVSFVVQAIRILDVP